MSDAPVFCLHSSHMQWFGMRHFIEFPLFALLLSLLVATLGCQEPASSTVGQADASHQADGDHDHGDHDHPAHGIRGGHLINLSGDKEVEVQFTDEADKFVIHVADAARPGTVTKVLMSTNIDGKLTDYSLEKAETDEGVVYEITSSGLAQAVKMGDVVNTTLTITTTDGDITGVYKHHAH